MDRERLDGRRIVVTGAASGIGLATAQLFHDLGARVALLDRDPAVVDLAAPLSGAVGLVVDVASSDSVNAAVAAAAKAFGGLDGLVNGAGYDFAGPIQETGPAEWDRLLAVNLTGAYSMVRAALPWLREADHATIVNTASGLGLRPIPLRSGYAASKAGLIMFSKAIAMELAPKIRVNVVCPGITDTPMLRKAWPTDEAIRKLTERYAIKEPATAEDVAYSILFMTSNLSRHITGTALSSDGGNSYH